LLFRGDPLSIAAIILAAGRSRRMGTQKLLLPWGGKTVIEQIADQILLAGLQPVLVVIGADAAADTAAIAQALAGRPITLAHNPNRDAEMLSSVRCGLKALPGDCEAALIALGDQPAIRTELIDSLIQAYQTAGRGIVMPTCRGKRGHPTMIAARYFGEILSGYDGVGLRGLLEAHPQDIHEVIVTDPAVLADIDHPDDYQRELAAGRINRPNEPPSSA
jgi:molybdenum cofactor cytidylyltransferase